MTVTSGHAVDCVLGSGPAAVACASELLKSGRNVMMVNPGRQLAPDRRALVEDFRRVACTRSDDAQLSKSGLPLELHRAQITDRRVSAFRVVEALDIVKHVCLCFIARP